MVAQVKVHRTLDWVVPSLVQAGSWAFVSSLLFHILYQQRVFNQVCRGGATLLVFNFPRKKWRLSCAARGEESLIRNE